MSYKDRAENFRFLWKIGDAEGAAREMADLADQAPRRDRLLFRLEEGAVKRLNLDAMGSAEAFEKAEADIFRYFGGHLRTPTRLSVEVMGILGSPRSAHCKLAMVCTRHCQTIHFAYLQPDLVREIASRQRVQQRVLEVGDLDDP